MTFVDSQTGLLGTSTFQYSIGLRKNMDRYNIFLKYDWIKSQEGALLSL